MAKRFVRVDLAPNARDFRPVAIEPGVPLLDLSNANARILFKWLGRFVADPQWDGDSVNFFVRDERGGRLEDVYCQPAGDDDLNGALKDELEVLKDRVSKAKAETATERAVLRATCENFNAVALNPDRLDRDCYFFRYRDVNNKARLVWCPGYQRADQQAGPAVICHNEECGMLFIRRPGHRAKCPGCQAPPPLQTKERRAIPWKWLALLLLLLLLFGGGGWYWFFYDGGLQIKPKRLDLVVGEIADLSVTSTTGSSEPIEISSPDPAIVEVTKAKRIVGRAEGSLAIIVSQGKKSRSVKVNVGPPDNLTLTAQPDSVSVAVGETATLKVRGQVQERQFEFATDLLTVEEKPAKEFAEFDQQAMTVRGVGATKTGSPQTLALKFREVQARVPIQVTGGAVDDDKHGKAVEVTIVSDQGKSVRFPVGALFDDFRVEVRFPDGFTKVITKKATLRASEDPSKAPMSFDAGRMVGIRPGKATVHAEYDGVPTKTGLEAEVTKDVDADELRITPSPAEIMPGETISLDVSGFKGGKSIGILTALGGVAWKSSDEKIVRSAGAQITGVATGKATLTASLAQLTSGPGEVNVVGSASGELKVEPTMIRIRVGETCRLGEDVALTRGGVNVTEEARVEVQQPDLVRYASARNALIGLKAGTTPIMFSVGDKITSAIVEVGEGGLEDGEVIIEPTAATRSPGQAADLRVFVKTKDGSRIDRTSAAKFTSADEAKVEMAANWACALAPGMVEVTASVPEAKTPGRAYITVDTNPITDLVVDPTQLTVGVGERARLRVMGRSDSGTYELFPQDTLKFVLGGANPNAVKVIGSQHVEGVAAGQANMDVSFADKLHRQVSVTVGNDPWSDLRIEPASATIHPGQRLVYMISGIKNGQRRVIWPQEGWRLAVTRPDVGEVVEDTFVRAVNIGETGVVAQFGAQRAEGVLHVVPGSGMEGVSIGSANPGITVRDVGGDIYSGGGDGRVVRVVRGRGYREVVRGSGYVPLPADSLITDVASERFQGIRASISNEIVPDFSLSLEISSPTANALEYRAYVPGETPPTNWVRSASDGVSQRAVVDTPKIRTGPLSQTYELTLEARDPRDNSVQQHHLRFKLPQKIDVEKTGESSKTAEPSSGTMPAIPGVTTPGGAAPAGETTEPKPGTIPSADPDAPRPGTVPPAN